MGHQLPLSWSFDSTEPLGPERPPMAGACREGCPFRRWNVCVMSITCNAAARCMGKPWVASGAGGTAAEVGQTQLPPAPLKTKHRSPKPVDARGTETPAKVQATPRRVKKKAIRVHRRAK